MYYIKNNIYAVPVMGGTKEDILSILGEALETDKVLNPVLDRMEFFGKSFPNAPYIKWRIDYPSAAYGDGAFYDERPHDYGWFSSEDDAIGFGKTRSKSGVVLAYKCA